MGGMKVNGITDEHIDSYVKDSWQVYEALVKMPPTKDTKVSVQLLNSMLQLHCMALKPVEIEAKVLPEYAKHKV